MNTESGWRRGFASLADEIAWRMARDSGDRRSSEESPIAIRAAIAGARAILLIVPGGLASLMTVLPAIRALRRELPEARFDLLAEPIVTSLMERDPLIDHAIGLLPLPALRQRRVFNTVFERVGGRGTDVVVNFAREDDRGLALIAQGAHAKLRLACLTQTTHGIYNVRVVPQNEDRYVVERNLAFVETLGLRAPVAFPSWIVPEREAEVAERLLRLKHLKGGRPLIAFDPGPGEGEAVHDRMAFGAFAEAVSRKAGSRGIVLSETEQRELPGSSGEGAEARAMGLAGLRETLAVLSRCDAFVGRNTGFFHAAVSFGLPAVGLFPRGTAAAWYPENYPGVLVLDADGDAGSNARIASQHIMGAWNTASGRRGPSAGVQSGDSSAGGPGAGGAELTGSADITGEAGVSGAAGIPGGGV